MKLKESKYLNKIKPVLKQLLDKLLIEFEYASILATDCKGKGYTISKSDTSVSNNPFSERGCVARVYNGKSYFEYAFNCIDHSSIDEIFEEIKRCSSNSKKNSQMRKHSILKEEEIESIKNYEVQKDPLELGDEKIIGIMHLQQEERNL